MSDFNSQIIGKTVSHYKIVELLGEGGMGVVYKAEDIKLKRTVALKFIKPEAAQTEDRKTRFFNEAQAVASLSHHNINTIYEIDEAEGQVFIAMEFIDGKSLKDMIKKEPLKINQMIRIAEQIAEGLQEAHEKGIIHRDIKSSNVMLTEKNHVKIMDFGLARIVGSTRITKTATAVGTVTYMSPEQAHGEMVDFRSDLWSFGIILYEMITGRLPFDGEQDQLVLYSILNKDPKPISGLRSQIPLELERIVEKCLEKKPSERYQSAKDILVDLKRLDRDITSGKAPTLTSVGVRPSAAQKKTRKVVPVAAGLVVIILMLFMIPSVRRGLKSLIGFSGEGERKGLLLLPFKVISEKQEDNDYCYGLIYLLTTQLMGFEHFQKSFWFFDPTIVFESEVSNSTEARRYFNVNRVVTSTWSRVENKVNIAINLVETKSGRILKTQEIAAHDDLSDLSDDIILKLAELLNIDLDPESRRILLGGDSPFPEANDLYLRARGSLKDYKDIKRIDTAIDYFTKATDLDGKFANALAGLGEALIKKWEKEKNPEYIDFAKHYGNLAVLNSKNSVPVLVTFGIINRTIGEYEAAIGQFRKALDINADYADAYREMAIAYERQGSLVDAESAYKEAIRLRPDYYLNYSHLGVFYYLNDRIDEAEEVLKKVISLAPENYNGYNSLGVVYHTMKNYDEAIKMYQKSNELHPSYSATSNIATLFFYNAQYGKAAEMYEEALTFNEKKYGLWRNLGDAYKNAKNLDKAKEAYQKAIHWAEVEFSVNPNDGPLCGKLALYYALYGNEINAEEKILRALNLQPENLSILNDSVVVFELNGQRDKALESLQTLLELGGSLSKIEESLDLLELRKDARFKDLLNK
jgi:tetratricopeptide (TPR) repeat protein/tRNA A-37 threonylcarbamoyl transferase component Bud32